MCLTSLKLIPWDMIRQCSAGNLMGYYEDQTKETTRKDVLKALCGIFLLDEAYALTKRGKQGYGAECLDQLMELNPSKSWCSSWMMKITRSQWGGSPGRLMTSSNLYYFTQMCETLWSWSHGIWLDNAVQEISWDTTKAKQKKPHVKMFWRH